MRVEGADTASVRPKAPRVVIVTGALGGVGRAICDALEATGWTVAGLDRPDVIESRTDHAFPGLLLGDGHHLDARSRVCIHCGCSDGRHADGPGQLRRRIDG